MTKDYTRAELEEFTVRMGAERMVQWAEEFKATVGAIEMACNQGHDSVVTGILVVVLIKDIYDAGYAAGRASMMTVVEGKP